MLMLCKTALTLSTKDAQEDMPADVLINTNTISIIQHRAKSLSDIVFIGGGNLTVCHNMAELCGSWNRIQPKRFDKDDIMIWEAGTQIMFRASRLLYIVKLPGDKKVMASHMSLGSTQVEGSFSQLKNHWITSLFNLENTEKLLKVL